MPSAPFLRLRCRSEPYQCDETKPSCSRCKTRGLQCTYHVASSLASVNDRGRFEYERFPVETAASKQLPCARRQPGLLVEDSTCFLSVRSSRAARSGDGTFQTLVPFKIDSKSLPIRSSPSVGRAVPSSERKGPRSHRPTPSPPLQVCDWPPADLTEHFASTLDYWFAQRGKDGGLGHWFGLVPRRLGHYPALDQAAACFVAGTTAVFSGDSQKVHEARVRYSKALSGIRRQLSDKEHSLSNENMTAVKLLEIFEVGSHLREPLLVGHYARVLIILGRS